MTILVTGSSGHLGEALVRTLRAQGRPCRGLDIAPSSFTDVVGSIADRGIVEHAMQAVDAVLHAATLHKPHVATTPASSSSTPTSRARSTCSKRRPRAACVPSCSPVPRVPSAMR
jgi:nucleoside-diphosphate-sugar epimerase